MDRDIKKSLNPALKKLTPLGLSSSINASPGTISTSSANGTLSPSMLSPSSATANAVFFASAQALNVSTIPSPLSGHTKLTKSGILESLPSPNTVKSPVFASEVKDPLILASQAMKKSENQVTVKTVEDYEDLLRQKDTEICHLKRRLLEQDNEILQLRVALEAKTKEPAVVSSDAPELVAQNGLSPTTEHPLIVSSNDEIALYVASEISS